MVEFKTGKEERRAENKGAEHIFVSELQVAEIAAQGLRRVRFLQGQAGVRDQEEGKEREKIA